MVSSFIIESCQFPYRWILAFVIGDLLQKEVDLFVQHWNSHMIRPSPHAECPGGIPNDLYDLPTCVGVSDHMKPVDPLLWAYGMLNESSPTPRFYPSSFYQDAAKILEQAWGLRKDDITPTSCMEVYTHLHQYLHVHGM